MTNKDKFIQKANVLYNNKFDYSKFNYINAKTKGIIICPIHGEFQQNPDKHLHSKYGCPDCRGNGISQSNKGKSTHKPIKSTTEFMKKAVDKFGDIFEFDLSNYSGITGNKIKIKCKKHGWFEKVPHVFLISGCGCNKCGAESKNQSKTKGYDDFLIQSKLIHGDNYIIPEYNRTSYVNRKSMIEITCKKHGVFKKTAQKFLSGQGCFKCRIQKLIDDGILVGGYNTELFDNNKDVSKEKGYLYYLKITTNNQIVYKVGITRKNVEDRVRGIKSKGKDTIKKIKILNIKESTLQEVYEYEQLLLQEFKDNRIFMGFSTELFNIDIRNTESFCEIFY